MNSIPDSPLRQHLKERLTTLANERVRGVQDALAVLQRALLSAISDEEVEQLVGGVERLADETLRSAVSRARDDANTAAQEELSRTRRQLQQELETARAEFDKREAMLEGRLATAERDISIIGQQRDEHAGSLHHARGRIAALEESNTKVAGELQLAVVRLEEERQRGVAIEKQLDAAHEELTRTRSRLQQELETARAEFGARQAELESQLADAERDVLTTRQHRNELAADLHQMRARIGAAEEAREKAALETQMASARLGEEIRRRATVEKQVEAARAEFDEQLAMLGSQLAEAENDVSTTRQQRDELEASLHHTRSRVDAAEDASAKAALDSQLASARLEEETQRRVAIEKQLDASRQELVLARAEADARRLEAQAAAGRVRAAESVASDMDARDVLAWVKRGVDALSTDAREQLLATLLDQLKRGFRVVGVFAVSQDGFRLWNTQPGEPKTLPPYVGTHDTGSLLSRAVSERAAARLEVSPGVEMRGLSEQPMAHAIAVPIIVKQRVLSVVYAENSSDRRPLGPHLLLAAEMLVDCLNRRLQSNGPSSEQLASEVAAAAADEVPAAAIERVSEPSSDAAATQSFAISRQAERLRIAGSVQLLVDGVSSALVDVSTLGAQVLSPATLRPNRIVRVLLPSGNGAFTCSGRIMWAQLEPPKPDTPPQYRSGIRFIDILPTAIESFISRHRSPKVPLPRRAAQFPS